ncbi:MAG: hypothetical protein AB7O24_08450 [Kofleriaceae bacterium]
MALSIPQMMMWFVLLFGATARADGFYLSESFGGTDVKDELSSHIDRAVRARLAIGARRGNWALEGWLAGSIGAVGTEHKVSPDCAARCEGHDTVRALITYGVDLKYIRPVTRHFEIYLRGGLSAGSLAVDGEYAGRGMGIGAGAQIKGKVPALGFLWFPLFFTGWGPKVTASLFVDSGYEFYRFHPGGRLDATPAIDAQLNHLMVGFAVGSDF